MILLLLQGLLGRRTLFLIPLMVLLTLVRWLISAMRGLLPVLMVPVSVPMLYSMLCPLPMVVLPILLGVITPVRPLLLLRRRSPRVVVVARRRLLLLHNFARLHLCTGCLNSRFRCCGGGLSRFLQIGRASCRERV